MLFIVSTPIGNLADMTFRAVETLKNVDLIVAEDTRHSSILLKHYEIKTHMDSFHSHSSDAKLDKIVDLLKQDKDVALISDAGTPGISDPGYKLIRAAVQNDIQISPIPGPSAVLAALVSSGLPMDKFIYLGFLPIKKGRNKIFETIVDEKRTVVIYESPHRIARTIKDLSKHLEKDRMIIIARELTKMYEEVIRGTMGEMASNEGLDKLKGEMVILIGGKNAKI